ncbi:MAG: hypothetical protein IJ996_02495 [Clostridia bacterium]|nr:hypothetical protein [Clostridia bacterium]
MAKKRKNTKFIQLMPVIAIVLGIISIIMMFLPAVGIKGTEMTYTGWQTAFGYTKEGIFEEAIIFNFSLILFIGFVLMISAVVLAVFQAITPRSNFFALLAVLCFVLAMLCWFLQIQFLSVGDGFSVGGLLQDNMQLGIGAVLGGITSACGAVACALPIFMKK